MTDKQALDNQAINYPGDEIDVRWDQQLCLHIGECVQAKGNLFVGERQPWCIPNESSAAEVREVVERCPSGALSYTDHSGIPESTPAENAVMVVYHGPLYLTGDLRIEGAGADMPGVRTRAALCRCGASRNKPFCDNSHLDANFNDVGAVGEKGPGLTGTGGPLTVKPLSDGPLQLAGNLTIRAATGRVAWQGANAFLCRCGASGNKPFCDGGHRAAGFKSEA